MPPVAESFKKTIAPTMAVMHCFPQMNTAVDKPTKPTRNELAPRRRDAMAMRMSANFHKEHLLHAAAREPVTGSIAQLIRALVNADQLNPQTLDKEIEKRAYRKDEDTRTARVIMRMGEDQANWVRRRIRALRVSESRYYQILLEMDAEYDLIGSMAAIAA